LKGALSRGLAVAGVLLALLAACGGSEEAEPGAPPAEPGSPPAEPATPPAEVAPAPTPTEGAVPWPLPDNPAELAEAAGLELQTREFFFLHVHAHLDVFVNGELVGIPGGIGVLITDPGVQSGEVNGAPAYGGIEVCEEPCISPVHTHDNTGVIHTESPENRLNHLGQFFTEWDVQLDEECVGGYCEPEASIAVYVDGEPYEENPADIELSDLRQITIVIGTPPAEVPSSYDWAGSGSA
jgi:hypothetical protein